MRKLAFWNLFRETVRVNTVVAPSIVMTPEQAQVLGAQKRNNKGQFARKSHPPTIKQLYRWAGDFYTNQRNRGAILASSLSPIPDLPTLEEYKRLLGDVQRWNYCREKAIERGLIKYREVIRLVGERFVNAAVRTRDYANQRTNRGDGTRLKIIDIFNDILTLCKSMPTIWDKENKSIRVITEPVVLLDLKNPSLRYEFGTYSLELRTTMSTYDGILVHANTPRYPREAVSQPERFTHPHVKNKILCFGRGATAAERHFQAGRFFEIVSIMCSTLQTYGASMGPHVKLEYWKGVCDVRFDPTTGLAIPIDTVIQVPVANTVICEACGAEVAELKACYDCGVENCTGCNERCHYPGCNSYFCNDHYNECDLCKNRYCASHTSEDDSDRCLLCYEATEDDYNEDELDEDEEG